MSSTFQVRIDRGNGNRAVVRCYSHADVSRLLGSIERDHEAKVVRLIARRRKSSEYLRTHLDTVPNRPRVKVLSIPNSR